MKPPFFFLDLDKGRSLALDRLFEYAANLPRDVLYLVTFEEWHKPLPHNLLARIKIPVRALAAFNDLTYEQMNRIVHAMFYPKKTVRIGGVEFEVSKDTMELSPNEAREIEADIHRLAGDIGCPIPQPNWDR